MAARVGLSRERISTEITVVFFSIEPTKLLFIVMETYVIDFTDVKI